MEITFYRKLANKVADVVVGNQAYTEAEAKRIRHGLICTFSDLYKFILFLIIFAIFSLTKEYMIAFTGILLLRPFLTGYHAKTEIACIFISFTTMLISILVGDMNILPYYLQITLIVILPVIGAIIAPVRKKVEGKNITVKLLTAFFTAAILMVDYYLLTGQIIFVSVIQIYLLTIYQAVLNYKNFYKLT